MTPKAVALAVLLAVAPAGLLACSPPAQQVSAEDAAAPAESARTLPDLTLTDATGERRRLHDQYDARALVLVMQGVGCPIVRKMTPGLRENMDAYAARNVRFLMVNSNVQDTPEKIVAELKEFELDITVLKDADQALGKALGAERTAEVFVVDPQSWKIVYHGPMDDRLTYGAEKAQADNYFLRDVLDAMLAGKDVPVIDQPADGCLINFI
jgi:peroxiredoxin